MHPLHELLQNPLTQERRTNDSVKLVKAFPALKACSTTHFLALNRYLSARPERFFNKNAYETFLTWLQKRDTTNRNSLKDYLSQYDAEINGALLFLREINAEGWHDTSPNIGDEYDLVRFIDKHVHPTYLRLVEAVLTPLTRPVAYFSRVDRKKGTEKLDIWSIAQELEQCPEKGLIHPYRNVIRNAIAHGGITYLQNEIRYTDKKGTQEKCGNISIVRLLDDLLDTCNGLVLALKVFLLVSRNEGYSPPLQLFIEELQEETRAPWWKIEGFVESEIAGMSQLTVYARPNSRDYSKVWLSTIQSGILAEYFAPGYDRYFFSLRSRKALPGWAAYDGKKLRKLRESGADDVNQYQGIIENDLIFYVPRRPISPFLKKLSSYAASFQTHIPLIIQRVKEDLGIPVIICRNATIHRNSWGSVLNADVVIEDLDDETAINVIRKHSGRIIRSALKLARRENRLDSTAYLPLGYAHVAVFKRDYRRRQLSDYGLGDDLVCTIKLQRISRIKSPDIIGSTVETIGGLRIAWNKAWLETNDSQLD